MTKMNNIITTRIIINFISLSFTGTARGSLARRPCNLENAVMALVTSNNNILLETSKFFVSLKINDEFHWFFLGGGEEGRGVEGPLFSIIFSINPRNS